MAFKNILDTIGNTPLVELSHYSPNQHVKIFAKLEGSNPAGSVKDRIALFMMNNAIKQNWLDRAKEILAPTSGNTGIALAMIATRLGYKFTAVMPESVSIERRKLLTAYGATIILTDGKGGTNYAIEIARDLALKHPEKYNMLDQFTDQANIMAHYDTTGPEIIRDMPQITHFVAGMGTGGTLMGAGQKLKEFNQNIQIIGIEPKPGSTIQGLRNMTAYTPPIFDRSKLDKTILMNDDTVAFELARDLFKQEGISVGMSSGAALWGAIQVSKELKNGVIVTVFPDRGDKYLNTVLFS
jgi:S-sulfo-L-cysteine synthase (O-acetyl-L-serine-dependent)